MKEPLLHAHTHKPVCVLSSPPRTVCFYMHTWARCCAEYAPAQYAINCTFLIGRTIKSMNFHKTLKVFRWLDTGQQLQKKKSQKRIYFKQHNDKTGLKKCNFRVLESLIKTHIYFNMLVKLPLEPMWMVHLRPCFIATTAVSVQTRCVWFRRHYH